MARPLTTFELRKRRPGRREYAMLPRLPLALVCDNFHYAWNVGATFRVADALRVEFVYLCGITEVPPSREIERTGGGAYRFLNFAHANSTQEVVLDLKSRGYQVVAAELAEGSVPLAQHVWKTPAAIVLGSEITGVQRGVIRHCDAALELPMFGMKNSLNVGSTAAVIAYDFFFRGCGGVFPQSDAGAVPAVPDTGP